MWSYALPCRATLVSELVLAWATIPATIFGFAAYVSGWLRHNWETFKRTPGLRRDIT